MVDYQPIVLPEQGQEMPDHTPRPQPTAPSPRAWTLEPRPRPRTLETYPLSGLEHLGLVTSHTPRQAVPTLWEGEPAGNTSDVDADLQLLGESAGGDSLPDISLPNAPFPSACPDRLVGDDWTSPRVAEDGMVVMFVCALGSYLVQLFVLMYSSQVLTITHIARFLDCSGFILFMSFVLVWFDS